MDNKKLSEQLRELASGNKGRTKTARLLDVIDDVEAALSAGVSRASVVEKLAANGLEMSLNTFSSALKRIRKKRGKPTASPNKSALQKATTNTKQESEPEPENNYDELAGLSARERRERRIAKYRVRLNKRH